jgi:hypothetical protein
MKEILRKLEEEKEELQGKIDRLETFLQSDKSDNISKYQEMLLNLQLSGMETYITALDYRISDIQNELGNKYN